MPEPAYVTVTRAAYDTVADDYAEFLKDELVHKPVDRAMLGAFADMVRGNGAVADLGCGPGRVTAYLDSLGVPAFGVDLSPRMVDVARRTYPGLRFTVGTMAALEVDSGSLGGIVAWYSIIHTPPEDLPAIFAEFRRVLAPGGHLLLAFQAGDERKRLEQAYGHTVSFDAYRLPPERVAGLLRRAGIVVTAQLVREPEPPEPTPQAFLIAR